MFKWDKDKGFYNKRKRKTGSSKFKLHVLWPRQLNVFLKLEVDAHSRESEKLNGWKEGTLLQEGVCVWFWEGSREVD